MKNGIGIRKFTIFKFCFSFERLEKLRKWERESKKIQKKMENHNGIRNFTIF